MRCQYRTNASQWSPPLSQDSIAQASYEVASDDRVNISLIESTLVPDALLKIFQKNYNLLLEIFNPEGWLDITYVDDSWRVGRDECAPCPLPPAPCPLRPTPYTAHPAP